MYMHIHSGSKEELESLEQQYEEGKWAPPWVPPDDLSKSSPTKENG